MTLIQKQCKKCGTLYSVRKERELTSFWCSRKCFHLDYKFPKEIIEKMRQSHLGKPTQKYPYILKKGYKMLYKPQHPNSNKQGYVFEHRFVMSEHIGRPLTKKEVVHHKDGNTGNNNISNLELCESAGKHTMRHHPEVMEKLRLSTIGLIPKNKNRGIKKCRFCQLEFESTLGASGKSFCNKKCFYLSRKGIKPKNMNGLKLGWGWNKGLPALWVKKGKESANYKHGRYCKK